MIIAVDTGGTHTRVAGFLENGEIGEVADFPTPHNPEEYIKHVVSHIYILRHAHSIEAISVALPGVIQNDNTAYCHNLDWNGVPILEMLRHYFPDTPVFIENDANLAGLASVALLGMPSRCTLYIALGTGIGTSIIIDGDLPDAIHNCEGSYMKVFWNKHQYTWSDIASARALHQAHGTLSNDSPASVWQDVARRITAGLQPLVSFIQPDTVIIGGALTPFFAHFSTYITGELSQQLPSFIPCPQLAATPRPTQTTLYGCYIHASQHLHAN